MAERRRAQYEIDRQARPPAWLRGGQAFDLPLHAADDGVLRGVAACPGVAAELARLWARTAARVPLAEPTAGVQPARRELTFMPPNRSFDQSSDWSRYVHAAGGCP